jgi:hypothetical protein
MKINLNEVAEWVTESEGLKQELSIAQIKEVIRVLFTESSLEDIIKIWFKYHK